MNVLELVLSNVKLIASLTTKDKYVILMTTACQLHDRD